jgi:signal transduction histidine kinase
VDHTQWAQDAEVVVGQHCRLVVERSRHVPLFGSEEAALLRGLGAHFDLVLDRVAAFEASEAARLQAQRATQGLQELVYGISHDLKNPLLTIAGFASLLDAEADRLTEDGRGYLVRIKSSTGYMKRLIDDLLQLSRVGHNDAERTDVDLRALVEEIGTDIRARYDGVSIECDTGVTLRINLVRARQLFTNLIENAARHGGHEQIAVRIAVRQRDDRFAEIHVADDGVGVPGPDREKVFGLFERLQGFSATAEGTGIGLTMCRRIVEDLSGSVKIVDSEVGTDICLCLPTAPDTPGNSRQNRKGVVSNA